PAASSPTLAGSGGSRFHNVPLKIAFMLGMTQQDFTAISTSRGPGSGTATRSMRSGSPGLCKRAARIAAVIGSLFSFDAGEADHLAPFRGLVGEELGEIGRC